ncbi:MAG TPA: hypothetical protein VKB86_00445 [Pyrinomonadaceae bacterium]|nr:hypothetical protein [Pyrinomonadaceae bacterium]
MSALVACLLLLTLSSPLNAATVNPEATPPAGTRLEDVITEWDWAQEVRLGKIAIESQTLTFCAGGRVRERIADDTGIHDSYGTWTLENTKDGYVLTLSGEQLHYRGRFPLTYSEKERAFYLHVGSGDRTWRYNAVRKGGPDQCAAPDDGKQTPKRASGAS